MWQSHEFMPGEFKQEFIKMRPGKAISSILVLFLLLNIVVTNTTMQYVLTGFVSMGSVWLSICGLSLAHWLFATFSIAWPIIIAFYVLFFMPVVSAIILLCLMLLSLIDGFIDLRQKFLKLKKL
jgi:hypothetical protein